MKKKSIWTKNLETRQDSIKRKLMCWDKWNMLLKELYNIFHCLLAGVLFFINFDDTISFSVK